MSERLNQLVDLSKMRDAGQISDDEFDRLKAEVMDPRENRNGDRSSEQPGGPTAWDQMRQIATDYPRVVGTAAGIAIVLVFVLIYMSGGNSSTTTIAPAAAPPETDPVTELPEDSLGITFGQLPTLWNELEQPPIVNGGIARAPESGPFDGFSHRFDSASILAGAYDPADDAIYALMVRASLSHSDISNMYLHVCYILHPFSSDCIDAYWDRGLNGGEFADYLEEDHFATWDFQGNEWRVEIVDGVQTLRVISPGSSRVAS